MFSNYKIVEDTLYLYVDYRFEFGSFNNYKKKTVIENVKDFIRKRNIIFKGTKIVLMFGGLLLGTIYLNKKQNTTYDVYPSDKYVYNIVSKSSDEQVLSNKIKEVVDSITINNLLEVTNSSIDKNTIINENKIIEKENNQVNISNQEPKTLVQEENKTASNNVVEKDTIITLNRTSGAKINIKLDEYLIGVVASEMPASFNIEALKAQAVASRTYVLKLLENNKEITDNNSTQNYKSNDELKNIWKENYNIYYNKVKTAVELTKDLYIVYDGQIIDAIYHSTSNGYTEDSINVWGNEFPYLKTVSSPWDTSVSSFLRTIELSFEDISGKLGFEINKDTMFEIISRNNSNRVSNIKVGDNNYSGVELRNLLGLRSSDFDIIRNENSITFTTRGYGHGVGMSQYGANEMAKSGYKYDEILKYYYTGVDIIKK